MEIISTGLELVKILKPRVFADSRGFFIESYHQKTFQEILGKDIIFVQDNHSHSCKHVLRGLHFQTRNPQGKLIRVIKGEVFDVAVDIRKNSTTFGKWTSMLLSENNHHMAWIPPGFAHGFLVLSETADVFYKVTTFYDPASDCSLLWEDSNLNITWPLKGNAPLLSEKDKKAKLFSEIEI